MEWQKLIDDGEKVPTLCDVYFGFLLANSGNNLMGNLRDGHHPKQAITLAITVSTRPEVALMMKIVFVIKRA